MTQDIGRIADATGLSQAESEVSALRVSIPCACRNCGGANWVCENHQDQPWEGVSTRDDACGCGAGAPCPVCNMELAAAGIVDRREKAIALWLAATEPSYSGWNDHDELFDNGWNSAIKWASVAIHFGKHWADLAKAEDRS